MKTSVIEDLSLYTYYKSYYIWVSFRCQKVFRGSYNWFKIYAWKTFTFTPNFLVQFVFYTYYLTNITNREKRLNINTLVYWGKSLPKWQLFSSSSQETLCGSRKRNKIFCYNSNFWCLFDKIHTRQARKLHALRIENQQHI